MKFLGLFLFLFGLGWEPAWAVNTEVLPKGVRSPGFRIGYITGLGEYFADNGSLYSLGDLKSVTVDARFLQNTSAEARSLVESFNNMGRSELGSQMNLGTIEIKTNPEVQYYALAFGYGITDRWTMGVGIPVINYSNEIEITSTRGNREFYASRFPGLHAQLDAAWRINLVDETHKTLAAKGYHDLESRNESYLGDAQVVSMYKFSSKPQDGGLLHQLTLSLPTGPQYDPDDLMALNQFGRRIVSNSINYSLPLFTRKLIAGSSLTYSQPLPDKVTERVPLDENDGLPDASQKEKVNRWFGASASALFDLRYSILDSLAVWTGYEFWTKAKDRYWGDQNSRYDLLEDHTDAKAQRLLLGLSADSVDSYLKKQIGIPMIAQVSYGTTVAGSNVERREQTELNLTLFF